MLALIAFALQTLTLDGQSLWYDEGFSAWLAGQPPAEIIARTAADIHPPLYYLLLHGWITLAGRTEFALRFPSVLAAVVTVPLLWRLARRLLGASTGDGAALLVAFSPLWLWYAREARMYTVVAALGVALLLMLVGQLQQASHPQRLAMLAVLNIVAVYTHFYAWFLVAVQVAWLLLWSWRSPRRVLVLLTPLVATLVAYLPWLGFVLNRLSADRSYWSGALNVRYVLTTLLENWATGHGAVPAVAQPLGVLLGGMAAAGLVALAARGRRREALALGLLVVLPVVGLLAVSFGRPKYHPRYLMLAAPGFLLALVALWSVTSGPRSVNRGQSSLLRDSTNNGPKQARRAWLGQRLGGLALLVPLLVFAFADVTTLVALPVPKDDWRGLAEVLQAANHGEPVLLVSGHAFPIFTYYDQRDRWIPLPDAPTLDTARIVGYADAAALERALSGATGVWVARWQDEVVDPDGVLTHLLGAAGATRDRRQSFPGLVLEHWQLPSVLELPAAPQPDVVLDANFDDDLTLLGLDAPPPTWGGAPPPADAGLPLTLFWEARRPLTRDLKVRLAVEDAEGFVWGVADRRPASYLHPTFRWRPGDPRPAEVVIPLEPGTPPGDYFVQLTVYSEDDPTGLDLLDATGAPAGKRLRLGPFAVAPPASPSPLPLQAGGGRGEVEAVTGTPVEPAFVRVEAPAGLEPGRRVALKLWWRATAAPGRDLRLYLGWRQDGQVLPDPLALAPGGPAWPTSRWRPGELVLTQAAPQLPVTASPGLVELVAWLAPAESPAPPPFVLATLTVTPGTHDFTPPAPDHVQLATFGEVARLVGYDLVPVEAGRPLEVTLFWQALGASERPITAFVHLLDAEGRLVTGQDTLPPRPTDSWMAEEFVAQRFELPLPADLAPGRYRLEVGWYDPADPTGSRLPVAGSGADSKNRRVLLETVVKIGD